MWLKRSKNLIKPLGTAQSLAAHQDSDSQPTPVSLVLQHRFAFPSWARVSLGSQASPVLVSIDSHCDVGDEGTFTASDQAGLAALDLGNPYDTSLFAWLALNANNDAQIFPALWAGLFSEALILLRQSGLNEFIHKTESVISRSGSRRRIRYLYDAESLTEAIKQSASPIFMDIDLDYFAEDRDADSGERVLVDEETIRSMLSLKGPLMSAMLPRIIGLTIALEPEYCGGAKNSVRILDILNEEFFAGTLLKRSGCCWKTQ